MATHSPDGPRIGVLAIQGDFDAHARALREAGAELSWSASPNSLRHRRSGHPRAANRRPFSSFWSATASSLACRTSSSTRPTFGTCAGCILLAKEVTHPSQQSLGVLDATVERNAYGRQIDSVIEDSETKLEGGPMELVYIRAPRIVKTGAGVKILAERDGFPVLVEQGHILAATFHPELSATAASIAALSTWCANIPRFVPEDYPDDARARNLCSKLCALHGCHPTDRLHGPALDASMRWNLIALCLCFLAAHIGSSLLILRSAQVATSSRPEGSSAGLS